MSRESGRIRKTFGNKTAASQIHAAVDAAPKLEPEPSAVSENGSGAALTVPNQPINFATVAQVGLFVLAAIYTLYFAKPVLMPIVLALLVSFALAPVVRGLRRTGLPEPIGAALVLALLVLAIGFAGYWLAEPAATWLERAPVELRKAGDAIADLRAPVDRMTEAAEQAEKLATVERDDEAVEVSIKQPELGEILVSTTQEILVSAALVLVLVYFLLASGDLFLKKMVHVMPRLRDKRAVVTVARGIEQNISAYLFGFTVNNAILGCAVTAALFYLGMPNPALWGVLAALLNFIPYAGALITGAILALVSMATFGDVSKAMTITGTFMVMTSLEGTLMQPIILGRRLELNPVAILVSVVIWGWLWGIPGALLAVPLLAFMKTVFDAVKPLSPVGELLGRY